MVEKKKNVTEIDGMRIDFQKDLLEQIEPTLEMMVNTIYYNSRWLLFTGVMLKKCEQIELMTKRLQEYLNKRVL